jgi:hypothetical protein
MDPQYGKPLFYALALEIIFKNLLQNQQAIFKQTRYKSFLGVANSSALKKGSSTLQRVDNKKIQN